MRAVPAPASLRASFTRILRGGRCPHPPRFARGQCPLPPRFAREQCPLPPRFALASTAFFGRRALECGVGAQSPSPVSMLFRSGGRPSETHLAQWAHRSRHPAQRFRGGFHGQGTEKSKKASRCFGTPDGHKKAPRFLAAHAGYSIFWGSGKLRRHIHEPEIERVTGDEVIAHALIDAMQAALHALAVQVALDAARDAVLGEQPREGRARGAVLGQQRRIVHHRQDGPPVCDFLRRVQ